MITTITIRQLVPTKRNPVRFSVRSAGLAPRYFTQASEALRDASYRESRYPASTIRLALLNQPEVTIPTSQP
jgi:hypothetical protein